MSAATTPSTSVEEVDLGVAGANYGWPNNEGPCALACQSPLFSYPHNGRDCGDHRRLRLPRLAVPRVRTDGAYFYADYTQNWIRGLTLGANGNVTGTFNFEPAGRLR